ncbi:MAG: S9 family peptidase [candidate division Zixibacteria bacterium]
MKKKPATKSKRSKLTARDLFRLRIPTSIAISPDESQVAYTIERMDAKKRKYFSNIHLLNLKNSQSSQFTHGDHNDSAAVFSPDGKTIAFVSSRDKKVGIYLMPVAGGAERQLIEIDGAIASLQWTPDGKQLVFALRYNDSHFIKDEKKKKEEPVFRHVTRLYFRLDGLGYLPHDTFQIYTLSVDSAKLKKITKGKRDNETPHVSPDGKSIAYFSNRSKNQDMDFLRLDLFVTSIDGGKERKLPTPAGPCMVPRFSPDGKTIAYLGHDNPEDEWGVTNWHIWKVGANGKRKAVDLMPTFDRSTEDSSIADMSDFHGGGAITFSADGKRIYFLSSDTGVTNLFYVPIRGGRPTRVYRGKVHVQQFSMAPKSRKVAMVIAELNNPGDIYSAAPAFGAEKKAVRHTHLNPWIAKERQLGKTKEVWIKSFDGTDIQGWIVTPPNYKPGGRKCPAILQIHGGPRAQYAFTFFHEMQYLAAQGYVVLYTNPRGGSGRGESWAGAISGGWGDLDYRDCMAAADFLERQKSVNPKRIGVTGGSYGGYMTNLMIGKTNRFKAAVTQRSVVDLSSFVGSSDMGFSLNREFAGYPWENRENYDKCSPITYFDKVKTPVLIIHSEQDLRCHIEQADQMFVKLKTMGKKVEMVRFPEEPHGLSRHGRPDRRIARLEWITKWFNRYLKK